ncbi:MAG: YggT family protein [Thiotrichales bacterium]|jgi:YggT family protein|nr:YggT family protein [Thiotrichales bacterium]
MTPTTQAGFFALQFITDIIVFFFIMRFALRFAHANTRSSFVYAVARITNPLCTPIARWVPYHPRYDFAALLWAFVLQACYYGLMALLLDKNYAVPGLLVLTFSDILRAFLNLWFLTIIAEAILSFIRPVQYDPNLSFISDINQPILTPIRRLLPHLGGIDLSPLVALFALKMTEILVVGWLVALGSQLV